MNRANENDSWVVSPDGSPGFTCSPITGCWRRCEWCFAMELANGRLRSLYMKNRKVALYNGMNITFNQALADPFWPRLWPAKFAEIAARKKPTGIFLNIMGEWADHRLNPEWLIDMFDCIRNCPQHRFYLLTKCPGDLIRFSPFPANCWVGVSAPNNTSLDKAMLGLAGIVASKRYISFEPLLLPVNFSEEDAELLNWIIIGALTGKKKLVSTLSAKYPDLTPLPFWGRWTLQPKLEWVKEIVLAADKAKIPVFLKDNLAPGLRAEKPFILRYKDELISYVRYPRQEFPNKEKKHD